MRPMPVKIHAGIDLLFVALLASGAFFMGFNEYMVPSSVLLASAIMILLYSCCTDYNNYGIFRVISFRVHLLLDLLSSAFLILSPWVFGFNRLIYNPFVAIGILGLLITAFSTDQSFKISGNNR